MENIFAILSLEKKASYIEELETKYRIQLPPIFRAFVRTFEFGKFNPSEKHRVIHPNDSIGYDGMELSLEGYINVYFDQDDLYTESKLLPFAMSGFYPFGICVGLGSDNLDKIILFEHNYDNGMKVIANDVFEFISQLEEVHWDSI